MVPPVYVRSNTSDVLFGRIAIADPHIVLERAVIMGLERRNRQQTAGLSECHRCGCSNEDAPREDCSRPAQSSTSRQLRCTLHFQYGSSAPFRACVRHVRCCSDCYQIAALRQTSKRAIKRLMHRSKKPCHSITSSAMASNLSGTVRPSALAVLRLITSSNLVGCCTGRSAGLSPLKMRST
jgi:hypothetical protein